MVDEATRNTVRVIVAEILNGKVEKLWNEKVSHELCKEKHKEVAALKTMLWGIIVLQLTVLGGVITALAK